MAIDSTIQLDRQAIARFCTTHDIARLAVFGSAIQGNLAAQSDVDLLVEFLPEKRIGYIEMSGLELELTRLIGRKVDLRTRGELSQYFRESVEAQAEVVFEC